MSEGKSSEVYYIKKSSFVGPALSQGPTPLGEQGFLSLGDGSRPAMGLVLLQGGVHLSHRGQLRPSGEAKSLTKKQWNRDWNLDSSHSCTYCEAL